MSILALMCLISCNTPTAKEVEEKRIADSIRVADSISMVENEKAQLAYDALTQNQKDSIQRIKKLQEFQERKNNTIKAPALYKAFQDNEVKAERDFTGKRFYIEGIIKNIDLYKPGEVHIYLDVDEFEPHLICVYRNEAMTAKFLFKGKKVTFLGTCSGFGKVKVNVFMDDCELSDNLSDLRK